MTKYSPSPRPDFDRPTLISRVGVTRHVWGDAEAGEVNDWIYASTDKVHCLVFGVGPEGSYRHSPEFRTVFGADEYLHVLEGEMTQYVGEEHRVIKVGELAHIPAGLPHATYNTGSSTLRFLAILSPTGETGPDVVDCFQEEPWKSLRPPIPYPSQQS